MSAALVGGWLVQYATTLPEVDGHECTPPEPDTDSADTWECDTCGRAFAKSWFQRNSVLPVSGDSA